MKNIGLLISTFVLLVILGFVACNKSETEKDQEMNGMKTTPISGTSYILGYLDSDTNIVYANYSELEKIYLNVGFFDTLGNTLLAIAPTSTVGTDGSVVKGIRTSWLTNDGKQYRILSEVFINVNADGNNEYILGKNSYINLGWSCVCKSIGCSNTGCTIWGDDPRFCDCTTCLSGTCDKTHTLTSHSKY